MPSPLVDRLKEKACSQKAMDATMIPDISDASKTAREAVIARHEDCDQHPERAVTDLLLPFLVLRRG